MLLVVVRQAHDFSLRLTEIDLTAKLATSVARRPRVAGQRNDLMAAKPSGEFPCARTTTSSGLA